MKALIEHCRSADQPGWLELRQALWPHCSREQHLEEMAAFVADPRKHLNLIAYSDTRKPLGIAEASIRADHVNGTTTSPVAFLEGLYVVPEARRNRIARALVAAVAQWATGRGLRELASDTALDNTLSHTVHLALGFVETERVVYFRRSLPGPEDASSARCLDPARSATPMKREMAPVPGLEIRIAQPGDAGDIAHLVAAFRDHLQASVPTDLDLEARLTDLLADPSIEFAYACLDGQAVGYTQTRFYASLWAAGIEALLEDVFVAAAVRGRAIGRALLRHALQRARQRRARLLGLTTNERNEAAQALYRSEGLRPQGARIWEGGREVRWVVELGDAE
jgi:aminoglycoside 6'-N-acetyltransferase I